MTITVRNPLSLDAAPAGVALDGLYQVYEEQCIPDPSRPVSSSQYTRPTIGYAVAGWYDYSAANGAILVVPGTVVLGNDGDQYDIDHRGCPATRRIVVRFSKEFFELAAEASEIDCPKFNVVGIPPGNTALKLFSTLMSAARGGEEGEIAAFQLAGSALAVRAARRRAHSVSERDRQRVILAVRYIESHYSESCALDRLANVSGLERYRLMRLFNGVTGQTPHQYVINTRIRTAATRLAETDTPISAIALDVGFNDIPHFGRYFRSVFGCSPRQMRKQLATKSQAARRLSSRFELVTSPPGQV